MAARICAALLPLFALFGLGTQAVHASTTWGIVYPANFSTTATNSLHGVSCTGIDFCMAVGDYTNSSGYLQTLAETWNGTSWSIISSPDATTTTTNDLEAVSCTSSTFCLATGWYCASACGTGTEIDQMYAAEWNGTALISSPVIEPGGSSISSTSGFNSVSCTSSSFCKITGTVDSCNIGAGLCTNVIEQYSGGTWSADTVPQVNGTVDQNLMDGVSCLSAAFCMAASGYYPNNTQYPDMLIWNGSTWSVEALPNNTADNEFLYDVSCSSTTSCLGVGYECPSNTSSPATCTTGTNYQTLAYDWNGSAWTAMPPADSSATQANVLFSVMCTASSSCIASGYYAGSADQNLMEQWNGSAWSLVSVPDTSSTVANVLYDTTCTNASFCMAVGYYVGSSATQTLSLEYVSSVHVNADILPGTLSFVSAPANLTFGSTTLTGANVVATASETFDIGDATGSGAGWDVTLSNTTFTAGTHTIPNAAFVAALPAAPSCDTGVSCVPAVWSGSATPPLGGAGLPGSTGAKLLSASAASGLGDQSVTIPWTATYPANSYAGTYSSTWTLTLASGP